MYDSFACMHACMYTRGPLHFMCLVLTKVRRGHLNPSTEYELRYGYEELNSGPMQEHQVFNCLWHPSSLLVFFFFNLMYMITLSAYTPVCQKMGTDPSIDDREPPYGYWELDSGLLEDKTMLLAVSHLSNLLVLFF